MQKSDDDIEEKTFLLAIWALLARMASVYIFNSSYMSYVVASKVKELLQKEGCNTAGDFADALSAAVEGLVKVAAKRAVANGRKTARATDL